MHVKTMEGLVGARMYADLTDAPMRTYKAACHRGDTAAMDRSLSYVDKFTDKAGDYKAEADKGMEEDAKEAGEQAKAECERAAKRREEERRKLEERIGERQEAAMSVGSGSDTIEVSEEGKLLFKDSMDLDAEGSSETEAKAAKEPMTYTKTGEASPQKPDAGISVSV